MKITMEVTSPYYAREATRAVEEFLVAFAGNGERISKGKPVFYTVGGVTCGNGFAVHGDKNHVYVTQRGGEG